MLHRAETIYKVFGLRNELTHHFLTPHFFVWFIEWNELIHHQLNPHSYLGRVWFEESLNPK
jgi:hypothetical protein